MAYVRLCVKYIVTDDLGCGGIPRGGGLDRDIGKTGGILTTKGTKEIPEHYARWSLVAEVYAMG
jgi:hypothetical protein